MSAGIASFAPGMFTSIRTDWATPWRLFEILDREFHFDLDVCAKNAEVSRCGMYFAPADNSLAEVCVWRRRCWMNPPYGAGIGNWVEKAYRSAQLGAAIYCEHIVCLLPARTDTSWWHDYCLKGEIRFLRGRLNFNDTRRARAPFPSAIVIFRAREEVIPREGTAGAPVREWSPSVDSWSLGVVQAHASDNAVDIVRSTIDRAGGTKR